MVAGMVLALALASSGAAAETYNLAPGHTAVHFSWNHAGLSRHTGRIVGAEGILEFTPEAPENSKVEANLQVGRISTGVAALDRVLRSADFFNAGTEPMIEFRSTSVKPTGDRTGEITGDLTINRMTKPVVLAVVWNFAGEHPLGLVNPSFSGKYVAGFSATGRLLRSEWGLGRGAPLVSDEIEIAIEVEAVRR